MFAVHVISTPEGLSFIGKGTADEDKLRANLVPDAFELWVAPAVDSREQMMAEYLGARAAMWTWEHRHPSEGWYPVPHHRAVAIVRTAQPIGWRLAQIEEAEPLAQLLKVFSCDQETLATILGVSAPTVSRLMAGKGQLSLHEWRRAQVYASLTGTHDVLAATFPIPALQAPAARGLHLVGGTEK